MIQTIADFYKMTNCEKLGLISGIIENLLKEFSENKIDIIQLAITADALLRGHENNKFQDETLDCAACYDFNYYVKLLFETLENDGDLKILDYKLQVWANAKAEDLVLDNFHFSNNEFFTTNIPQISHRLYYFDFNIYQHIEDRKLNESVKKKDITIVYSPAHLEEVYRMKNKHYEQLRIRTLSEITGDRVVLRKTKELKVYIEKPIHSFNRVLQNIPLSEAIENKRLTKNKDRIIFFKDIQDEKFKYITDDKDVFKIIAEKDFNTLLNFSGCILSTDDFQKDKKSYDEILHMIYSLYDVLDNVSFLNEKVKKDGRAVKSSVYDIEHLIYATHCDYLVTADEKMARRAKQIYNFLKIHTQVIFICEEYPLESFLE